MRSAWRAIMEYKERLLGRPKSRRPGQAVGAAQDVAAGAPNDDAPLNVSVQRQGCTEYARLVELAGTEHMTRRAALLVSEPWDFDAADGSGRVAVEVAGIVRGPDQPNWQGHYILLRVLRPFVFEGEVVECLIAAPRYEGDTIDRIATAGGVVGAARVRAGVRIDDGETFEPGHVEYCFIGSLKLDDLP